MLQEMTGRRAHVTGAAAGIGLGVARRLAAAGARVALSDIDEAAAKAAAADLGEGHIGMGCDVTDTSGVQAAIDATVAEFGGLDVLVNNAGIEIAAPMAETDETEFKRLLDVNVVGVWRCTRAALPAMTESGGSVVNIASVAGVGGSPLLGAYCASKAGVIRMTECLALELRASGIRVNAVCPAFVDTPMAARFGDKALETFGIEFNDLIAAKQGRMGSVEDIAELVAYLASDRSTFVTGSHHRVDGGLCAGIL